MKTEAQKKAQAKYIVSKVKQVIIDLNENTMQDVIDILESVPSKQGFIVSLIRADIAREKAEQELKSKELPHEEDSSTL